MAAPLSTGPPLPGDSAPRRVGQRVRMPIPLTSFIGREADIAVVGARLSRFELRLLSLTGPGGVGKTRLAIEVADRVGSAFDQVWFVPLAAVRDPALVAPTIMRALGRAQTGGSSLPAEELGAILGDRTALLVLDNFEQVVEAAPQVVELLDACPRLTVMVTSRVLVRVSGEYYLPVPPLETTEPGESLDLPSLLRYESVRLFLERAGALGPQFTLTGENAHAVVEICRRLDGLPLALELAAARSNQLYLAEMLPRLQHSLGLLTGGARVLPERQRTVRAIGIVARHWMDRLHSP